MNPHMTQVSEHQAAVDAAAQKVYEYLKQHNPEVIELLKKPTTLAFGESDGDDADSLKKDLTAGDVHATTALGNQKKKQSFADALKERKAGGKKPVAVPDDGVISTLKRDTDWELPLEIVKADADQHLIFGWASIATLDGQIVVDKQDDMILPEDLEKAAYEYLRFVQEANFDKVDGFLEKHAPHLADQFKLFIKSSGVGYYDMHSGAAKGHLIESMMFTKQKQDVLKIDLGLEGWWVGFYVDDAELWALHKSGKRPEFSIGGRGRRVPV